MALLLNIDTATTYGAMALSLNGKVLSAIENFSQKEHATFLHTAIETVLADNDTQLTELDAIVIVIGPGSYTGLRVGLSAAKGLCYATSKPLIAVNTLQAIALAAMVKPPQTDGPILYIPMIDARRMEVFTAAYDVSNQLYSSPVAATVDEHFADTFPAEYALVFAGDGSRKLKQILPEGTYYFSEATHTIQQVAYIGEEKFNKSLFEDVAYSEPFYLKPFFSAAFVKR